MNKKEKIQTVIINVGIPGSGKSTTIKNVIGYKHALVSSDNLREYLFGDASVQGKVWPAFYGVLHSYLVDDYDKIVVDATNCNKKDRRNLINFIRAHSNADTLLIIGYYFNVSKNTALERNKKRERKVPESVINNMYSSLKNALPSLEDGFDDIFEFNEEWQSQYSYLYS